MSTLILAEKPDQARAYMRGLGIKYKGKASVGHGSTFLDDKTVVVSAAGHLVDLEEPESYGEEFKNRDNLDALPLMPSEFMYNLDPSKENYYENIKRNMRYANRVIVATDNDNEGCAIAYNAIHLIQSETNDDMTSKTFLRAYPSALNKEAVVRQFKHLEPIEDSQNHAFAAIVRSQSDWLIGMNLSRLYTYKLKEVGISGNFAIGRAISTTLNLICQWNKAIINFKPAPIYELMGKVIINNHPFSLTSSIRVVGTNDKDFDPRRKYIGLLKQHHLIKQQMPGQVSRVEVVKKEQFPPILMTKGDLYNEMHRVAGWTQARSKKVMQANYDMGYQTYPRTDSGKITEYMYQYLVDKFDDYLKQIGLAGKFQKYQMPKEKLSKYLTSEKSAGAHLAIIPTEKIMGPDAEVSDDQRLMWEVVVRKSLTLLINPYTYVSNRLQITLNEVEFTNSNTTALSQGWKAILLPNKKATKKQNDNKSNTGFDFSKYLHKGQKLLVTMKTECSKTRPPKPLKSIQIYDRGGLMEKAYKYVDDEKYAKILKQAKGIGTSATRDQAMASLIQKKYIRVDKKDIITVTPNGWLINWLLSKSRVNDPLLTAQWEEEYKLIGDGQEKMSKLLVQTEQLVTAEFKRANKDWNTELIRQRYAQWSEKDNEDLSVGKCPQCGATVTFVNGKYPAYRCSSKSCDFKIYYYRGGKTISKTNAIRLLDLKPTTLIKQMEAKNGDHYDGRLILKRQENGEYRLKLYHLPQERHLRHPKIKNFRKNRKRG